MLKQTFVFQMCVWFKNDIIGTSLWSRKIRRRRCTGVFRYCSYGWEHSIDCFKQRLGHVVDRRCPLGFVILLHRSLFLGHLHIWGAQQVPVNGKRSSKSGQKEPNRQNALSKAKHLSGTPLISWGLAWRHFWKRNCFRLHDFQIERVGWFPWQVAFLQVA